MTQLSVLNQLKNKIYISHIAAPKHADGVGGGKYQTEGDVVCKTC